MMRTILSSLGLVVMMALACAQPFTYQGLLKQNGTPANGTYQMTFRLYDVASGGAALGTVGPINVSVANGLFTVELNFPASVWDGGLRYLEIQVGGTTLAPRVKINPTPYASAIRMFESGTANPDRMVIAHSPAYWNWGLQYQDAPDKFNFLASGIPVMTVDLGGQRVGIGTSSPASRLHIVSSADTALFATTASGFAAVDGRNSNSTGRGVFGWTTATTGVNFGVFGQSDSGAGIGVYGWATATSGNPTAILARCDSPGGFGGYFIGRGYFEYNSSISNATLRLHETEADYARLEFTNTNTARKWHIAGFIGAAQADDRLNIWNSAAGDILSVRGDGTVAVKVLEITGADLAEKFPVSEPDLQPGMVVEIDPDQPGNLRLARGAYNKRVAGVVAGANGLSKGIVLGNLEGSDHHAPIAISGRVWVYADATEQAIEPGDFLTTAARPGYAMKANDLRQAQGAIIGKAMTRLEKGKTGLVLVIVNLQ